jgi:hypothetical protein
MDGLYYYVHRTDETLSKSKDALNLLDLKKLVAQLGKLKRAPRDETGSGSDKEDDSEEEEVEDEDDVVVDPTQEREAYTLITDDRLGDKLWKLWRKRRPDLQHPFAIAGYYLCPVPEVMEHRKLNGTGCERIEVEQLLVKLFLPEEEEDSKAASTLIDKFWDEFDLFEGRRGVFYSRPCLWSSASLVIGKSHLWHKKYTYHLENGILGKFACRVCSKIVGIGSAERNWGDVKTLKTGKRSHLSAEATEKQATIYGASRAFEARNRRDDETINVWSEDDFNSNLDMLAPDVTDGLEPKLQTFKAWFEDWEEEWVTTKSAVAEARLLAKYGGIDFFDVDTNSLMLICKTEMEWVRVKMSKGERVLGGWCIKAAPKDVRKPEDEDYTTFDVGDESCIYYLIKKYHKNRNDLDLDVTHYERGEDESESEDTATTEDEEDNAE